MTQQQIATSREKRANQFTGCTHYFRSDYSKHPSDTCEGVCIPLTHGRHALIDAEDFDKVGCGFWHCFKNKKNMYARGRPNGDSELLHTLILPKPEKKLQIDHINGNGLDNRKINLRVCTQSQNQWNQKVKPGNWKGAWFCEKRNNWHSYISKDGKRKHLGTFLNPMEAAKRYDEEARKLFGPFAKLNFPEGAPHATH